MKKISVLFFMVTIVIGIMMVTGCDMKNQSTFPANQYAELNKKTSDADCRVLNSQLEDPAAYNRTMEMVADTIDRDVSFAVTFFYHDIDNYDVVEMPALATRTQFMNNDEYRRALKADLQNAMLDQIDEYDLSDHGEVVATVLKWEAVSLNPFGSKTEYSVVDFDGDGKWDYGCKEGCVSIHMNTHQDHNGREIDEYNDLCLKDDSLVALSDLEGNETFQELQKLLK